MNQCCEKKRCGLFGRLRNGGGLFDCCKKDDCCPQPCAPTCAAPACAPECPPVNQCCEKKKCGLFGRLRNGGGLFNCCDKDDCCTQTCAPTCAAPVNQCCESRKRCGLFSRLFNCCDDDDCCVQGCVPHGQPVGPGAIPATPAPADGGAAPAPAPPEDPRAYFPSRFRGGIEQTAAKETGKGHNRLAVLLGLAD